MRKKFLSAVELLDIGLILVAIFGFYEQTNSITRFTPKIESLRFAIDLLITSTLLLRASQIVRNFNKSYHDVGKLKTWESVAYTICVISLIPDLSTWFQWFYFAGLYLPIFIFFAFSLMTWLIEIMERMSTPANRIRNYGLSVLIIAVPLIAYSFYLSSIY